MGREEIRRLCLNVWASPAVSPGGPAGCRLWRILQRPGATCQNSDKVHFGTGYRSIAPGSPDPITSDQSDQVLTGWGGSGFFSGTGGTHRGTVQNPGALCGRLGAGVVAYVPRYGAYVTLSRAPRGTALFPVHCCHSSLFVGSVFRNGSQCFASGATCRPSRIVALCRAAMRRFGGPAALARDGTV